MGVGRKFAKKPVTRPRKSGTERKRRDALHVKRLVALGVDEKKVKRMTSREVTRQVAATVKTKARAARAARRAAVQA